ncbi:hypothetical protein T10_13290 [Trichinella papuae]|uniref:Uncharacterized protein n=1 Tax=Trichinella papuae TaxID=268474 RepID=A0A0V1MRT4_9BILA|nr:hypothetical protein T10_13290 [Trichinella papuae]
MQVQDCTTSYVAPFPRIAIIHSPHHCLSFTLFINDQLQKLKEAQLVLLCSFVATFQMGLVASPTGNTRSGLPLDLSKVEETLQPVVVQVALNCQDQGCFENTKKLRGIKLDAKFFRFGMEHFKYPAIRWQIFSNSQTMSHPRTSSYSEPTASHQALLQKLIDHLSANDTLKIAHRIVVVDCSAVSRRSLRLDGSRGWWKHCLPAHHKFIYWPRILFSQPFQFLKLLLMSECMGVYSAAICMLSGWYY